MTSGCPLTQINARWESSGWPALWRSLLLASVLLAIIEMAGCGMSTTELPASTQPGGPGFLSIITPQLEDGVEGLPYTATINTSGGSGVLNTCTVLSGNLPAGFSPPLAQGSECILTTNGQVVTGAPGRYTFTLEAGDSSTPQRSDRRVYSLTIRPTFTINSPAIPDGITGRSYTRTFTITTNLQDHAGVSVIGSSEAGNGPITSCSIAGLPPGFAAGGGTSSCAIDSSHVNIVITMNAPRGALLAGVYPFSISITDSAIKAANQTAAVVPAQVITITPSLTVRQEFSITQASLADGVQGRTYGVAPLAQPEQTNVVAAAPVSNSGQATELGNGPLTQCTLAISPADPALSIVVDPSNPSHCLLTSASAVAVAGSYSVTVSATDSPILDPASPGQVVVPPNTMTRTLTWNVDPPISYTVTFDTPAGQPGQLPDAVENRSYGAPARSSVTATATGGLSGEAGAKIIQGGILPAGVICTAQPSSPVPALICSSNSRAVGAPLGATTFTITASDPGNAATSPGSSSTDLNGHSSHTIKVDAPLALASNYGSTLPQAVQNRSYGAAPLSPVIYTASGGLGGYVFSTQTGANTPGNAFPAAITCSQGSGASSNLFSCGTSTSAVITATPSTAAYSPTVTLDDVANTTTPDGASSGTGASQSDALIVNPPLSIKLSGSATVQPPPGVAGRTYGTGAGFSALIYTVSGGVPPYTISPINQAASPTSNGVPSPMLCSNLPASPAPPIQMVCESATGITANPGVYPFTVSVSDAGTAADPVSVVTLPQSITINQAMTLTPQFGSLPLAVSGRTYGDVAMTCASGSCVPVNYNINGGLGGYSPIATPNGFPGTFACPFTSTGSLAGTYACSNTTGISGVSPATLSITASDTANSATPAQTLTTSTSSLNIAAPLSLTLTSGTPPPAVFGRVYGSGTGCSGGLCQPVVYSVSGGTGSYPAAASMSTSAGPFTCALSGSNYDCSSSGITLASGVAPLNITVSDNANVSTPSASASNNSSTLTVNPALSITGPSGTLAIAVDNRTYGVGSTCGAGGTSSCSVISYNITGGLGSYTTTPTLNGYPGTFQCSFSSAGPLSGTYSCSSPAGVTGSGSPVVSITASDTANTSTPTASATSNTATLPISPVLTFTPPTTVNPAVTGRAYGQGSGCTGTGGACAPIAYGIGGGTTAYNSSATMTTTAGPFACALNSSTYNCSSTGITGSSVATLNISVSDIANASTPSGNTSDSSKSLAIDPALSLTPVTQTGNPAVEGRTYGNTLESDCGSGGTQCQPLTFTASGGLGSGTYISPATLTITSPATGSFNGAFSCPLQPGTSNYTCTTSTSALNFTPAPAQGSSTAVSLSVAVSDTGNASTPSGTASGTTATSTASLAIDSPMQIAPALGQGTPASGVVGRSYGNPSLNTCGPAGNAQCQPVKYTVSGGLGNYSTSPTITGSATPLTGLSCSLSSGTYSCGTTGGGTLGVTGAPTFPVNDTLTVSTTETGNGSTPSGSATTSGGGNLPLTVNDTLQLALAPSTLPAAVTGRSFGTGSNCGASGTTGCLPLQFTASGGTTNYTYTDTSQLSASGFGCASSGANYTCTTSRVTGTSAIDLSTVTVKDVPNASTPATSSPVDIASSLPINAALSVSSSPVPPDALLGYDYSSFFTLQATGGLSSVGTNWIMWSPPPPFSTSCRPDAPSSRANLTLNSSSGLLSGTASPAAQYSFSACVTDTANASTPSGSAALPNPPNTFTFSVLTPYAYITDPGLGDIEVINTGTATTSPGSTIVTTVSLGSTTSPSSVAVTQDGLDAFVTISGGKLAGIDTVANTTLATSPFTLAPPFLSTASCTTPKSIAIASTNAYVACNNGGASHDEVFVVPLTNLTSSTLTASVAIDLGAPNLVPTAIAASPDGTTVAVTDSNPAPQLQIISTSSNTITSSVSLSAGMTPVALVLAPNGANIYAYIAEQKSGAAGQVDVVSIAGGLGSLKTSITSFPSFGTSPVVNPAPASIAVTPDFKQVYVGVQQTDQFGIIDNTSSTPTLLATYSFPGLSAGAQGTLAPAGIAIPPIATVPLSGYRLFFTTTAPGASPTGTVYIFDATGGSGNTPSPDAVPTVGLQAQTGTTPAAIAPIPLPTLP